MANERVRSRNRRRVVAASLASFLALLGYEAARVADGSDPALARSDSKAATTDSKQSATDSKQSTTSQSTTTQQSTTSTQGDSGQGYYTPPASDTPTTGSS